MSAGLSVLLPAFNEASHIDAHLRRLARRLDQGQRPFEILVIDDGSGDGTGDAARTVAAEDARIRVLAHERNRGKGRALATGCAAAAQPIVVFYDADLEIPPRDIEPLVARLEAAGADLAIGSKYHADADLDWPLPRRALSRIYHLATAVLFRLPLRDTQTGLKAVRRDVAQDLVPRLRSERFAWDLELILLAHREGLRFVTGPVTVAPSARASRVGLYGALHAGVDTLRIWARDVGLAAYRPRRARTPARTTQAFVCGDDLGLSASIDAGLARGVEAGGLDGVSALADGSSLDAALAELPRGADVGLHLDLLGGRGLARQLAHATLADDAATRLRTQHAALSTRGLRVTRVDAHRHAWCLPWVYRRACRAAAACGVRVVRPVAPAGPLATHGLAEGAKRLLLMTLGVFSRGVARQHGLASAEAWVDAREAAGWVAAGAVPAWARGRRLEVIGHPAIGAPDWPVGEQGTLDRAAETRAVLEPPLAAGLRAMGVALPRTLPTDGSETR